MASLACSLGRSPFIIPGLANKDAKSPHSLSVRLTKPVEHLFAIQIEKKSPGKDGTGRDREKDGNAWQRGRRTARQVAKVMFTSPLALAAKHAGLTRPNVTPSQTMSC